MGERRPYAISRFENNVDFIPEYVEGEFEIPMIKPEIYEDGIEFLPFNVARQYQYKRERFGVHFFIGDYLFKNIWVQREKYRNVFPEFGAVLSPDFSVYIDWPPMVQMWNHYRKHLLGAWMQDIGCKVYPTVTWGDERSYRWCFDGEPYHGTVCVSSWGRYRDREMREMFVRGYDKMLEVLDPETILFYGTVPKECTGNIVRMETFTQRLRKKDDI